MAHQPFAAGPAGEPIRNTTLDLTHMSVREVNRLLHAASQGDFLIKNPHGLHAIVAGLDGELKVCIDGHVGYYCAGMNKRASITINGNACTGPGNAVWVSSVQTSQYVFAGQFGINGYELGWPGAAGNTGTFRTGDNRTVYVMGGIIYNVV